MMHLVQRLRHTPHMKRGSVTFGPTRLPDTERTRMEQDRRIRHRHARCHWAAAVTANATTPEPGAAAHKRPELYPSTWRATSAYSNADLVQRHWPGSEPGDPQLYPALGHGKRR